MSTIKDIANLAGVSRGTVDRVLNKRGGVHPKTAARVLEIARSLDYKPNKAGIVLSAQRRNLKIGVVMFGTNNPFFDEIKQGLRDSEYELSSYNCEILVKSTPTPDVEDQIEAIDELVRQGINALAIVPQNQKGVAKKIDELYDLGIPTVTFNSDIPSSKRIAYVGSNYRKSGQTVAGLMQLFDHSSQLNIGVVGGLKSVHCHTERIEGFKDVISTNPNMRIVDVVWCYDDNELCYEQVTKLLQDNPDTNAVYFTAGAIKGGCDAIKALGKTKDMLIIAHDKVPSTQELIREQMIQATVCQQPLLQGSMPLHLLFDYLTTGEQPQEYNYTDIEIYIKENL